MNVMFSSTRAAILTHNGLEPITILVRAIGADHNATIYKTNNDNNNFERRDVHHRSTRWIGTSHKCRGSNRKSKLQRERLKERNTLGHAYQLTLSLIEANTPVEAGINMQARRT